MSEMLANQMMGQNDSLRKEIEQKEYSMKELSDMICSLLDANKKLRAREKRLLSDNRKLRKRAKELEERLAAAEQRLENFRKNILQDPKLRAKVEKDPKFLDAYHALLSQQKGW